MKPLYLSRLVLVPLFALLAKASLCHAEEPLSLMQTIGQWQYHGSKMSSATMSDAATTNASGERILQSVQLKAVFTTKEPMPEVIAYYRSRPMSAGISNALKPEEKAAADTGISVTFHDDSRERPLAIHVILVNTDKTSTTLVISRAATESETHIAWTQYRKL